MGTFGLSLQEVIDLNPEQDRYKCLGLDKYPLFNEDYREGLNEKIIEHFNEQEIAHETDSMFMYAMRRKMNEIMPLYNQHYLASQIKIDPLLTVNMRAVACGTVETDTTDATTSNSNTDSKGRVVGSNTPQVRLSGNSDYATSAQDNVGETNVAGTANTTTNQDQKVSNNNQNFGYTGNPAELVFTMRQTFVNVDMMVINELDELFMSVWDNGDEFSRIGNYPIYSIGIWPYGLY